MAIMEHLSENTHQRYWWEVKVTQGGPLSHIGVHMCEQKKGKGGLFYSMTRKMRFMFGGLKMLFFKKKQERGSF